MCMHIYLFVFVHILFSYTYFRFLSLFPFIKIDLFQLASVDVSSGTRLLVNSLVRDRYPISYIYGFHSRGFSYFLTVQKTQAEGQNSKPFISKLGKLYNLSCFVLCVIFAAKVNYQY